MDISIVIRINRYTVIAVGICISIVIYYGINLGISSDSDIRIDTVIDSRINVYTDSEVDTSSNIGFSIDTVSYCWFLNI